MKLYYIILNFILKYCKQINKIKESRSFSIFYNNIITKFLKLFL
jgi:hypothetical protein